MASITKNEVTLNGPDRGEAGVMYQFTYSIDANTGRAYSVEFEFQSTGGGYRKLVFNVAGS